MKRKDLISQILIGVMLFLTIASPIKALTLSGEDAKADFYGICKYAGNQTQACRNCIDNNLGIWTAIGCIPATQSGLFEKIFTLGLSMAGGIAFLLILFGGFQILASAGNPEQLNGGRELVSSAVAGLLLIIFSVFLLRLVGYDILRIPGFGGS